MRAMRAVCAMCAIGRARLTVPAGPSPAAAQPPVGDSVGALEPRAPRMAALPHTKQPANPVVIAHPSSGGNANPPPAKRGRLRTAAGQAATWPHLGPRTRRMPLSGVVIAGNGAHQASARRLDGAGRQLGGVAPGSHPLPIQRHCRIPWSCKPSCTHTKAPHTRTHRSQPCRPPRCSPWPPQGCSQRCPAPLSNTCCPASEAARQLPGGYSAPHPPPWPASRWRQAKRGGLERAGALPRLAAARGQTWAPLWSGPGQRC